MKLDCWLIPPILSFEEKNNTCTCVGTSGLYLVQSHEYVRIKGIEQGNKDHRVDWEAVEVLGINNTEWHIQFEPAAMNRDQGIMPKTYKTLQ